MKTKLLTFILLLVPLLISAQEINRVKWEEDKKLGTWQGKLADSWVVSASSKNKDGVSEIQMITCPGTDKKIMVTTDMDEKKKFRHSISIPKEFPFQVQVDPSKNAPGVVATITLKDGSFWVIFTDPERNLIGINNFP